MSQDLLPGRSLLRARAGAATLCALMMPVLASCDGETPTTAAVENDYPAVADGAAASTQSVVYRAWYASTVFLEPVAAGATSDTLRTVPSSDYVYVVLAVGWDPASGAAPSKLVPMRSKGQLRVARGDLGLIKVSTATFDGDCASGHPLSQDDADFITQRIFPGAFAGTTYDAATCTATAVAPDGGAADASKD